MVLEKTPDHPTQVSWLAGNDNVNEAAHPAVQGNVDKSDIGEHGPERVTVGETGEGFRRYRRKWPDCRVLKRPRTRPKGAVSNS